MKKIIVIRGGPGDEGPLDKDEFALNDRRSSTMGPPQREVSNPIGNLFIKN
jgi:hypothetical protein